MIQQLFLKLQVISILFLTSLSFAEDLSSTENAQITDVDKPIKVGASPENPIAHLYVLMYHSDYKHTRNKAFKYLKAAMIVDADADYDEFQIKDLELVRRELSNMLDSGDLEQAKYAAQAIYYGGSSDKVLFDNIHQKLLMGYQKNLDDEVHIDRMAWFARALSASGNEEYLPTLQQVAKSSNEKLSMYGSWSVGLLPEFADWVDKLDLLENATKGDELHLAVLESPYIQLKFPAAFYIRKNESLYTDSEVINLVLAEIKAYYPYMRRNRHETTAAGHMLKILVRYCTEECIPVLVEASENSPSRHFRSYVGGFLKKLRERLEGEK